MKTLLVILALLLFVAYAQSAEITEDEGVLVLDDSNFDEAIKKHPQLLVEFYAPWCGHCKNLEPHWNQLASEMKGKKIKIAKIDADKNKNIGGRFQVQGFPTIKVFPPGTKTSSAETYEVFIIK